MKSREFPYIIFADKASYEISGLVVTRLPPPIKPAQRYEEAIVPGVDGSLTVLDGTAESIPLPVEFYAKNYDAAIAANAWLCGMGELILSTSPEKAYTARIYDAIEWNEPEDFDGVYTTQVIFTAQPYPFIERTAEFKVESGATVLITNSYDVTAYPLIHFTRTEETTAKVLINGEKVLEVPNWDETEMIIDSEIMECYASDLTPRNEFCYSFPEFSPKETYSVYCEGCSVIIKPRWRCKG